MNTVNLLAALTGYTCWALILIILALVIYSVVRERIDGRAGEELDVPDWLSQANADRDLDEEWKRASWGDGNG